MADDSTWLAEDWQLYFEKCVEIGVLGGVMTQNIAESLAFGDTVKMYMKRNDVARSTAVYDLRRKMGVNP